MGNYIPSELLKQRRAFTKKLIWIAPLLTLFISAFAPVWYQQNSYNWWYVLLYPGCLTLLCILAEQRDWARLKYRAVYPLPVDLKKVWYAKIITCIIYIVAANLIFMLGNLLGSGIIWLVFRIPVRIHIIQALTGTVCIILTSAWNIPLCLWLSQKAGPFAALIGNMALSVMTGLLGADTALWILCPYSWVPRLMVPVLGILPNGEIASPGDLPVPVLLMALTFFLSFALLYILSKATAGAFSEQEVC